MALVRGSSSKVGSVLAGMLLIGKWKGKRSEVDLRVVEAAGFE